MKIEEILATLHREKRIGEYVSGDDHRRASIYEIAEKICVHFHDATSAETPTDDLFFYDTYNEAAEKVICDLFEDEFRETIETFLDENLKGYDYQGSFRPDHTIFINLDHFDIFEVYQASGNYSINSNSAAIFNNGYEGGYSESYFVSQAMDEGCDDQFFTDETRPEGWEDMDWVERTTWVIENSELVEDAFDGWWRATRDEILEQAFENIKEYVAQSTIR